VTAPQPQCFARRHMSMAACAYHSYAFGVSATSRVFYSNDRRDAEEFHASKNTVGTIRAALERRGWLVPLDKGKKRKVNPVTGQRMSIRYRVLSHDEWAATHPGHCHFPKPENPVPNLGTGPVPNTGTGEESQSQILESPVPNIDFACPKNDVSPVPKIGTKVVSDSKSLRGGGGSPKEEPVPKTGTGTQTAAKQKHEYDHQRSRRFWKAAPIGCVPWLKKTFGVTSPARLTDEQYKAAMEYFARCKPMVH